MGKRPRKFADSKAELIRTVAAVSAAAATLFLVGKQVGLW